MPMVQIGNSYRNIDGEQLKDYMLEIEQHSKPSRLYVTVERVFWSMCSCAGLALFFLLIELLKMQGYFQ